MAKQTVVGMFDNAVEAQQAVRDLQAAGFSQESCDIASRPGGTTSATSARNNDGSLDSDHYNETGTMVEGAADATGRGAEKAGNAFSRFFDNLFGDDAEESTRYSHVAQHSGSIVTVHCDSEANAHRAAEILDAAGAVDVDERASQYGYNAASYDLGRDTTGTARTANLEGEQSMKVMREDLEVGKREVEKGGARLRSRIVERPVEETVRLREEHVFVNRERVDRPATDADFAAFEEGSVELRERAEIPVVRKEARVVEEVRLGKEATERQETIRDTVRSTEVDIERLDTDETDRRTDRTDNLGDRRL